MCGDLYREAIEYEMLTQKIYQEILNKEGVENIEVQHNMSLLGRSGVEHQVDVFWKFRQAGVDHKVIIECKNYSSNITLEKIRNLFGVLHDVGNSQGLMVTKTGYQEGVVTFAEYYGIGLKLLRIPTDEDWEGRIRRIEVNFVSRNAVSTPERPVVVDIQVQGATEEQHERMMAAVAADPRALQLTPDSKLYNAAGEPATREMRWWLPAQLDVLGYQDGGPYIKEVDLNDHFIKIDLGDGDELIRVVSVRITFHVETGTSSRIAIDANKIIEAVLIDAETGEWEHVQRTD